MAKKKSQEGKMGLLTFVRKQEFKKLVAFSSDAGSCYTTEKDF